MLPDVEKYDLKNSPRVRLLFLAMACLYALSTAVEIARTGSSQVLPWTIASVVVLFAAALILRVSEAYVKKMRAIAFLFQLSLTGTSGLLSFLTKDDEFRGR